LFTQGISLERSEEMTEMAENKPLFSFLPNALSARIGGQALTKRDQGLRGARRGTSRGQGQGGGHAPQKLAEEV
jgi:hypothetical protein